MDTKRSYHYHVVDVFTQVPLAGNAAAVFPKAQGLDDATMQSIARELNLPETVFIFPPRRKGTAARIRIFAPKKEMDFAGHPTLAAGYIALHEKMVPTGATTFALEENVGVVPLRSEDGMLWLTTPPIHKRQSIAPDVAAAVLQLSPERLLPIAPQVLDAGNPTLLVGLRDTADVDAATFDSAAWTRLRHEYRMGPMCVFFFAPVTGGAYSRMFGPDYGIPEDPASGSCTGPLGLYMMQHQLAPSSSGTRLVSEQGAKMGRRSLLHIHIRGDSGHEAIEVGGHITPVIQATMHF